MDDVQDVLEVHKPSEWPRLTDAEVRHRLDDLRGLADAHEHRMTGKEAADHAKRIREDIELGEAEFRKRKDALQRLAPK